MKRTLIAHDISYSQDQSKVITQLESDLKDHMFEAKPNRFAHSISVGHCAETMAQVYGVDMFSARLAGILHDWDKLLTDEETLNLAVKYNLQMSAPYEKILGLLHGPLAAKTLLHRYPWLSKDILSAIEKHTTGSIVMTDLDKIIYVADLIEPLRPDYESVQKTRELYLKGASLDDVYESAFCGVMIYVISSRRYLYPESVDLYNKMVEGISK